MCPVSHVRCHISGVTCQVSHVNCHVSCVMWHVSYVIYFFLQSGWVGWLRLCYQPRLVFRFVLIKHTLIPNIYSSRLEVVCFGSSKKANWWEINIRVIGLVFKYQKWQTSAAAKSAPGPHFQKLDIGFNKKKI